MFLHLSVSHSVHRGGGGGLQAHTQGGCWGVWLGEISRPTPREGCWGVWPGVVSRPTPRGRLGVWPGRVSRPTPSGWILACTEADPPQETATASGGTHPTGMHSCLTLFNATTLWCQYDVIWLEGYNMHARWLQVVPPSLPLRSATAMFSWHLFQFGSWTDFSLDLLIRAELKSGRMNQHAGVLDTDWKYWFKIMCILGQLVLLTCRKSDRTRIYLNLFNHAWPLSFEPNPCWLHVSNVLFGYCCQKRTDLSLKVPNMTKLMVHEQESI